MENRAYDRKWQDFTRECRHNKHIYLYFLIECYIKDRVINCTPNFRVHYKDMKDFIMDPPNDTVNHGLMLHAYIKNKRYESQQNFICHHFFYFKGIKIGKPESPSIHRIMDKYRTGFYSIKEVAQLAETPGIIEDMTPQEHESYRTHVLELLGQN